MIRVFVTILLITNVLTCPFSCYLGATCKYFVCRSAECSGCPKPDEPRESSPKSPQEDKDGCNCFCGGAVMHCGKSECERQVDSDCSHAIHTLQMVPAGVNVVCLAKGEASATQ